MKAILFDRLLTQAELARRLKVNVATLWRWRRHDSDPLPCLKLGGKVYFDPLAVDRWVRRRS